jgi:hypothetical protein
MRSRNAAPTYRKTGLAFAVAAGLALSACTSGDAETKPTPAGVVATASPEAATGPTPSLVFNDLGGGSSIIEVYPGPTESSTDRGANATYSHGDMVAVDCQTTGREVHSHPERGEENRTSDIWYRLGETATAQYATAVYASITPSEAVVPACPTE